MKNKVPDYAKHYPVRFYGNKRLLLDQILAMVPKGSKTFIDLFSGTGIVGWAAKRTGARVITNDIMGYAHLKGRALVANNKTILNDDDIKILLAPNSRKGNSATELYGHVFGKTNATFIDNWVANIPKLPDQSKQDIAILLPIVCAAELSIGVMSAYLYN